MSATIWTITESGSDRRPAPPRRQGYWSGNQGQPVRQLIGESEETARLTRPVRALAR
ncbi:MAG: hypothetical protein ACRDO2_09370 [Nocardioidaceae bacterium]|jgi:hypothetical protein